MTGLMEEDEDESEDQQVRDVIAIIMLVQFLGECQGLMMYMYRLGDYMYYYVLGCAHRIINSTPA